MKQKISISVDEKKIKIIKELLRDGKFRNQSHVIEYSLDRLLNDIKEHNI